MTTFTPSDIVCAFREKQDSLSRTSDLIIDIHRLASEIETSNHNASAIALKYRLAADQLAKAGNEYNEYLMHGTK